LLNRFFLRCKYEAKLSVGCDDHKSFSAVHIIVSNKPILS